MVEIYTDGACLGNPGNGGWACVLITQDQEKVLQGAEPDTTNNRMELTAAIEGLKALTRPVSVDVYTDSQYVRQGITQWVHTWMRKGWKKSDNKPVKNADLWQQLLDVAAPHQVRWHRVKAHNGHELNERVDQLAREAAQAIAG